MKQNAMGLANICILSTGVLLVISTTSCLWFGMQEIIQTRFPHQIAVEVNDTLMSANGDGTALTKEEISSVREQINNYLEEQQVSKRFERDETYWLAVAENKEESNEDKTEKTNVRKEDNDERKNDNKRN